MRKRLAALAVWLSSVDSSDWCVFCGLMCLFLGVGWRWSWPLALVVVGSLLVLIPFIIVWLSRGSRKE